MKSCCWTWNIQILLEVKAVCVSRVCVCFVQVTALVKLKECEDTHLGEEVDRNWGEVVTQQFVFDRLNREVRITHEGRQMNPHVHFMSLGFDAEVVTSFLLLTYIHLKKQSFLHGILANCNHF